LFPYECLLVRPDQPSLGTSGLALVPPVEAESKASSAITKSSTGAAWRVDASHV